MYFGAPVTLPWSPVSGAACVSTPVRVQQANPKETPYISLRMRVKEPDFWCNLVGLTWRVHFWVAFPDLQIRLSCWTASPWAYEVLNGIFGMLEPHPGQTLRGSSPENARAKQTPSRSRILVPTPPPPRSCDRRQETRRHL